MRKYLLAILPFLFPILYSCTSAVDSKIANSIAELYSGEISIAKGIKSSVAKGHETIYTISILNNEFVSIGWLPADAMANNCAMMAIKSKSQELENVDLIAVEIQSDKLLQFQFERTDVSSIERDYDMMNDVVSKFISNLKEGEIEKCYEYLDTSNNVSASNDEFNSFLSTVSTTVPKDYINSRLIGFKLDDSNSTGVGYWATAVMISEDGLQRMILFRLNKVDDRFSISEVTI